MQSKKGNEPGTKRAKKDKFEALQNAAREELENSNLNEFVAAVNEERKGREEKKELPYEDDAVEKAEVASEELEPVNKKDLKKAEPYEDGSRKGITILAVILLVGLLVMGYFYFIGGSPQPKIILSSSPITEKVSIKDESPAVFKPGNSIYIHFVTGGRLGVDEISIHISRLDKQNPKNSAVTVTRAKRTISPGFRYLSTHFQADYFHVPGAYRVEVLSPTGEILSTQGFEIR